MKTHYDQLPRFFAICGRPKAGKGEVEKILVKHLGATVLDSGGPLRKIGMEYFGLTRDQVYTQAGKAEFVTIAGRRMQVREFLGELGNRFEEMFGPQISAFMVHTPVADKPGFFTDASVRKTQGHYWRNVAGAPVIEVIRPGTEPSPYLFDRYDRTAVTHELHNCGTLEDLEAAVLMLLDSLYGWVPSPSIAPEVWQPELVDG